MHSAMLHQTKLLWNFKTFVVLHCFHHTNHICVMYWRIKQKIQHFQLWVQFWTLSNKRSKVCVQKMQMNSWKFIFPYTLALVQNSSDMTWYVEMCLLSWPFPIYQIFCPCIFLYMLDPYNTLQLSESMTLSIQSLVIMLCLWAR